VHKILNLLVPYNQRPENISSFPGEDKQFERSHSDVFNIIVINCLCHMIIMFKEGHVAGNSYYRSYLFEILYGLWHKESRFPLNVILGKLFLPLQGGDQKGRG
jgi:hypothetical protein